MMYEEFASFAITNNSSIHHPFCLVVRALWNSAYSTRPLFQCIGVVVRVTKLFINNLLKVLLHKFIGHKHKWWWSRIYWTIISFDKDLNRNFLWRNRPKLLLSLKLHGLRLIFNPQSTKIFTIKVILRKMERLIKDLCLCIMEWEGRHIYQLKTYSKCTFIYRTTESLSELCCIIVVTQKNNTRNTMWWT